MRITVLLATSVVALCHWPALAQDQPAEKASSDNISWLAEVQTPPKALPHDAPKLKPLLANDTTREAWHKHREEIRAGG